jgi:hypothetical protein
MIVAKDESGEAKVLVSQNGVFELNRVVRE